MTDQQIIQRPAHPGNYTRGRNGRTPEMIVIHVADGTFDGTLSWFQEARSPASAHYTVATDGRIGQSVQEKDAAWHAGDWKTNARSVGIEHEGMPSRGLWKPSDAQYRASARLAAGICTRWGIPVDRTHIIAHSEVDPSRVGRRNCPGPTWDWDLYLKLIRQAMQPAPVATPGHVKDGSENRRLRLFSANTNELIVYATLIEGTDKAYVDMDELDANLAALRNK